ncbi:arsenite methyltransferase [Nocardia sp. SYP-A9097]|uniref:arsenite methyltransferase n=1 Tax=Nocardia sp. SYP-A9097 TaxID=2663237 RepID=UPI00129B1A03|nr:arsenite methyltransferase [Nocardia sp. SYP-A9097]MRH93557.1 arsenite methyltransferase [Nocardia sp. SYP-A9097]
MSELNNELRETVRSRYAAAATAVAAGGTAEDCCGGSDCCATGAIDLDENFGASLYAAADRDQLPIQAVAASLGCGNPTAVADLREGERVLDLGSGGGIDVLLSAHRVGPTGKAFGVDMTDEMLELANANAAKAAVTNVEFLKGTIEAIPLPDSSIDVVISNCVINLSTDKPAVFTEMARVLVAGGRIGITDVVSDDALTPAQRAERGDYVGCIAGALSFTEYRNQLAAAGFDNIEITSTHAVADGMHSAIIKAHKPATESSCCAGDCCSTQ